MASPVVDWPAGRALASEQLLGSARQGSVGWRSLEQGNRVSYESHAEPIKLGYLFDFKLAGRLSEGDAGRPDQTVRAGLRGGPRSRASSIARSRSSSAKSRACPRARSRRSSTRTASSSTRAASPSSARPSPTTAYRPGKRSRSASTCRRSASPGTDDWLGEWTFSLPQGR